MFSASFARRFVSLLMVSFFQRGELLAADASGVPADEVRGDEDEHRAHGRGQKQLIFTYGSKVFGVRRIQLR